MNNRNLLCYALDYLSIAALACAGAALLARTFKSLSKLIC